MAVFSIRTKLTLVLSLLVTILLAAMAFVTYAIYQRQFEDTLSQQQFSAVSALAGEIDGKLSLAKNQLVALAGSLPPAILDQPALVQEYLDSRPVVRKIFDNGILFIAPSGRLTAVSPLQLDVLGMDFSDREYFRETLQTSRPFISKPFVSRQRAGHPILMLTAPVFDGQGNLAAVLGGSLDLLGENFLARILELLAATRASSSTRGSLTSSTRSPTSTSGTRSTSTVWRNCRSGRASASRPTPVRC
jgi:two-component system NtrC family sensor kinase